MALTNLSIKNVPERLAARLREQAKRNHRSMQGELMAMLEDRLGRPERSSPSELLAAARALGVSSDGSDGSDSVRMIREDRDSR